MIRVLIADDDVLVRRYLSTILDWKANGYELAGTARDGRQALEMVTSLQVQILLTDMDMPVMNGIQLMTELKNMPSPPRVVILSCHDDFAYVREALRMGAEEYLLKDEVTAEKLLQTLQGLSVQDAASDMGRADLTDKTKEQQREELLYLLDGTVEESSLIKPDALLAVRLIDYEERAAEQSSVQRERFYEAISDMCETRTEQMTAARALHVRGAWFAVLCDLPAERTQQEKRYILRGIAVLLEREARRHFDLQVQIGAAEIFQGKIPEAWNRARDLTGYAFYERSNIFYSWQNEPMGDTLPISADQFLENLDELKAYGDRETVRKACDEIRSAFLAEHTKESLVITWLRKADQKLLNEPRPAPRTFQEMEESMSVYPGACEERLSDTSEYSESIARAVRFIQKRCSDNISLQDAAEEAGLSVAYFSFTFHVETVCLLTHKD